MGRTRLPPRRSCGKAAMVASADESRERGLCALANIDVHVAVGECPHTEVALERNRLSSESELGRSDDAVSLANGIANADALQLSEEVVEHRDVRERDLLHRSIRLKRP